MEAALDEVIAHGGRAVVAITRQDPDGKIPGVLNASEGVDLATMISAYTIEGAWLMHQEKTPVPSK